MHFIYIIYSTESDKYYIGETINVINRLEEHNTKFYKNASTAFANDWELKLTLKVQNRNEARVVESYIKSMKSRKFIFSLCINKNYYNIFKQSILEKFKISILD